MMEEGKKKYLAIKKKDSFKADEFSFTYSMLKLDELYNIGNEIRYLCAAYMQRIDIARFG